MSSNARRQVYTGIQLAMGLIAGLCTMMLLGYGLGKLRHPETDTSLFTFLRHYPPRVVGAVCFTIAVGILCTTVDRWAKMLSGLFGYAVVGGLLAVAAGGFHSTIAVLRLTRAQAGVMTVLYAACALLSFRIGTRRLNWVDRAAALSAPLLLMWAATSDNATTGFKALSAMVAIFTAAAVHDHLRQRRAAPPGGLGHS